MNIEEFRAELDALKREVREIKNYYCDRTAKIIIVDYTLHVNRYEVSPGSNEENWQQFWNLIAHWEAAEAAVQAREYSPESITFTIGLAERHATFSISVSEAHTDDEETRCYRNLHAKLFRVARKAMTYKLMTNAS